MGESLSKLFVPFHSLPGLYDLPDVCLEPTFDPEQHLAPTLGGIVQLLFMASVYGYILFTASNWIADGSELLLLIPRFAPIVGSVVLPVLGAVPDGAIVLFSGLGDIATAQKQLSVGVGALAGSTIMLLTIPWFLSVFAGRVDIVDDHCTYKKPGNAPTDWNKLTGTLPFWTGSGTEPDRSAIRQGAIVMLITCIPYLLIQGSAFATYGETSDEITAGEKYFALAGLITCTIFFFAYLVYQVRGSGTNVVMQNVVDELRADALKSGMLSLSGAFLDFLHEDMGDQPESSLLGREKELHRFRATVRRFFMKYDVNGDQCIDKEELRMLLRDLHVRSDEANLNRLMGEMDHDDSGDIQFEEFVHSMVHMVRTGDLASRSNNSSTNTARYGATNNETRHARIGSVSDLFIAREEGQLNLPPPPPPAGAGTASSAAAAECDEDEEEEQEEVPQDLADLPPDEQQRRIMMRSLKLMLAGTVVVILVSDAMVDVLAELGDVCGVPAFYVSFVLAPLASNASELIASYNYAIKKTTKTITISLSTLEGAAIMNNTFCLGIFLALVYFRGLRWSFSAETISILFVQACMGFLAMQRIQTMRVALIVGMLFPLSIVIVVFLESSIVGLD